MNPSIRSDSGFALLSQMVNLCGMKTMKNPQTGEPFSRDDFMPNTPGYEPPPVTLEKAMKDWS